MEEHLPIARPGMRREMPSIRADRAHRRRSGGRRRDRRLMVYGIFRYLADHPADHARRRTRWRRPIAQIPPAPRIEEHPAIEMQELHAQEDKILSTYGWTDKKAGVVRIPIDRAMELQLQRGFPSAKGGSQEMKIRLIARSSAFTCAAHCASRAQIYAPSRKRRLYAPSRLLQKVGINQKMGAQIPLDLPFTDESGRDVTLRQYFGKPVILALVYYQCPSLCNMVLNGVVAQRQERCDLTAGKRV